jgi:hypothetical protein
VLHFVWKDVKKWFSMSTLESCLDFEEWSREKIIGKGVVSGTPSSRCFSHGCAKGFWKELKKPRSMTRRWIGFTQLWLLGSQQTPHTLWSTGGVAKQYQDPEILVRGVTSLCWPYH